MEDLELEEERNELLLEDLLEELPLLTEPLLLRVELLLLRTDELLLRGALLLLLTDEPLLRTDELLLLTDELLLLTAELLLLRTEEEPLLMEALDPLFLITRVPLFLTLFTLRMSWRGDTKRCGLWCE